MTVAGISVLESRSVDSIHESRNPGAPPSLEAAPGGTFVAGVVSGGAPWMRFELFWETDPNWQTPSNRRNSLVPLEILLHSTYRNPSWAPRMDSSRTVRRVRDRVVCKDWIPLEDPAAAGAGPRRPVFWPPAAWRRTGRVLTLVSPICMPSLSGSPWARAGLRREGLYLQREPDGRRSRVPIEGRLRLEGRPLSADSTGFPAVVHLPTSCAQPPFGSDQISEKQRTLGRAPSSLLLAPSSVERSPTWSPAPPSRVSPRAGALVDWSTGLFAEAQAQGAKGRRSRLGSGMSLPGNPNAPHRGAALLRSALTGGGDSIGDTQGQLITSCRPPRPPTGQLRKLPWAASRARP